MTADHASALDLLEVASRVLAGNGFTVATEVLDVSSTPWLLAENDLFIVSVAAGLAMEDLRRIEPVAAQALLDRVASSAAGTKRWDAYLVLIAPQRADNAVHARQLIDLQYDTRGLRRLVALDVQPTNEDVKRVLRPFIPLPPTQPDTVDDAFNDLREQLVVNGVTRSEAERMVNAFLDRGNLEDV